MMLLRCILQAHECETIMPICLANDSTCVILSGDHLQMVPRVYSNEARSLGFDRSLTERLDHLYTEQCQQFAGSPPIVRLRVNYRNNVEITQFLSSMLYNNQLIPVSTQVPVPGRSPMNFYAVCGREQQDRDSTSFYNVSEVEELTRRVKDLYFDWPAAEWDILVTAAYTDQASTDSRHNLQGAPLYIVCFALNLEIVFYFFT